jgi:hypothetical protein
MIFNPRRMAIATTLLCVPLVGCAHTSIANDVPQCERLIPKSWKAGIPPADLPVPEKLEDGHDNAKPWQEGFAAQTGQLEKANDRAVDTDYIYSECLRLHREKLKESKRGFFGRLFADIF